MLALRGERPSARELHGQIGEILAQPEYQPPEMTWADELAARIAEWVQRWLGSWGTGFARLHEAWPILYWAIVALLVLVLAAVLYHIFWTLATAFGARRRKARVVADVRAGAAPDDLRVLARGLASQGRFGEALAALHAALIRLLDLRGALRYDEARTNWEYLDAVSGKSDLTEVLRPLTVMLDPVLYGGEGLREADYRTCEALVERAFSEGVAA